MTRVAILGGGPAGVSGAWRLRQRDRAEVTLIERNEYVGGNSGSFPYREHFLDFGSHRLHPASDPGILEDIRGFLGDELLDRPRHGRIRLLGKWVHFPLKPVDLLFHLDKSFALGTLGNMLSKALPKKAREGEENFATVLEDNLGSTICSQFYFPYARKLWGYEPSELSAIQAYKRVSAGSFGKLIKKVLSAVPGLKPEGAGRFFYPKRGFGQISDAYANESARLGADLWLGWSVENVTRTSENAWKVVARRGDETRDLEVDHIWSTLPVSLLSRMLDPAPPAKLLQRANEIDYRAMILIYLEVETAQFTEFDAHYFPGADVTITRLSEPKNYAVRSEPHDRTVLCAELPCARGDEHWNMSDEELGEVMARDLEASGLPLPSKPVAVFTRRPPQAYPIYQTGYENALDPLDEWISQLPNLLTYGRQGLFAHDNTHHAIYMAYAAVECLRDGKFDGPRWAEFRREFSKHVVED